MAHRDHVAVEPVGRVADDRRRLRVAVEGAGAADGLRFEVVAREAGGRGAGRGMGGTRLRGRRLGLHRCASDAGSTGLARMVAMKVEARVVRIGVKLFIVDSEGIG